MPISLRVAIQIGFVALCGAVGVGALMIAKGMRLVFAGDPQSAYATGGTLKPTHAVTMHAILVLPMLAWLLSFANWSERQRLGVVLLAAGGYIVVAAGVAMENFAGRTMGHMPVGLIALLAAGTFTFLAAGLMTLRAVARRSGPQGLQHGQP